VPTLAGGAPTAGGPTITAGTPLSGGPTIAAGTPEADRPPGGRRGRDDEPRIASPRRSTTLDDAEEPQPRAGRRAAPEPADDMAERTDRRPESDGGADAAVKVDDQAPAGPDAGREVGAHARTDRDDSAEPQTDGGAVEKAIEDNGHATRETDADESRETDTTARKADADGTARDIDDRLDTEADAGRAEDAQPNAAARVDAPLRPGDVDETLITFWDEKAVQRFRGEWHEVKADFVDDPVAALTRAHDLITEAVDDLTEALLAERDELDPLRDTSTPDTESMRMAMRGYREFLDRILAL
jgi:hypothetical protein